MRDTASCGIACLPTISWVRDLDRTLLVDDERKRCWTLQGVEATIWDLVCLGYGWTQIVDFLATLLATSEDKAAMRLKAAIQEWKKEGIVFVPEEEQRG